MFKVLRDWIQRYFSDEEAVVLAVLLFLAFTAVLTLGGMLAPVLAGMVLAYLMQGLVVTLERLRVPGGVAVGLVFALFMGVLLVFIVVVVPLLWHQLITLFNEFPAACQVAIARYCCCRNATRIWCPTNKCCGPLKWREAKSAILVNGR